MAHTVCGTCVPSYVVPVLRTYPYTIVVCLCNVLYVYPLTGRDITCTHTGALLHLLVINTLHKKSGRLHTCRLVDLWAEPQQISSLVLLLQGTLYSESSRDALLISMFISSLLAMSGCAVYHSLVIAILIGLQLCFSEKRWSPKPTPMHI